MLTDGPTAFPIHAPHYQAIESQQNFSHSFVLRANYCCQLYGNYI
jgi:hypothetical protein